MRPCVCFGAAGECPLCRLAAADPRYEELFSRLEKDEKLVFGRPLTHAEIDELLKRKVDCCPGGNGVKSSAGEQSS